MGYWWRGVGDNWRRGIEKEVCRQGQQRGGGCSVEVGGLQTKLGLVKGTYRVVPYY